MSATAAVTLRSFEEVREAYRTKDLKQALYDEGEGIVIAMLPDGRRIGIAQSDFREISPFAATDWVRLRLPDGRTGWSNRRDAFLCSSHMDDEPGQCRGIGAQ